ncbi:hypothetical protein [Actinophytocola sp.]|uniref:helix-turn-helix domain-containing protein n=1 Tax=Actinophytocola sp. TaxID=1872138 RepID=UPI002EDA8784
MSPYSLRTANYSDDDRERLAEAVAQARRAIGHDSRPSFAKEAKVGIRSLEAVEAAEATVGVSVLERIARALARHLRDWTVDTPRTILDGGPVPSHEPARTATLDVRWVAREEFITLLESDADAGTYSRKLNQWRDRFAAAGFDDKDLLEVSRQAEDAADKGE